jgi:hypothetical protein
MTVGQWSFIPAPQLTPEDTIGRAAFDQARGLLELYQRSRLQPEFGCFLRRARPLVGARFRYGDLGPLRRALLVALLDRRPPLEELGAGHGAWTSDNAVIYGHRIGDEGYVSAEYGSMSRMVTLGLRVGDANSAISPPIEMPFPMLGRDPDHEYLGALFAVLTSATDARRRLLRTIDWFDLAWRNTPSTSGDMRILMLKAGFESLLAVGHGLDRQRNALDALLSQTRGRRRQRRYNTRAGAQVNEVMSDLGWWFTNFTFLRNAIAHGDQVAPGSYRFGRQWHLFKAEAHLREAIKETVALQGHPDVRFEGLDRALRQAQRALGLPES